MIVKRCMIVNKTVFTNEMEQYKSSEPEVTEVRLNIIAAVNQTNNHRMKLSNTTKQPRP